MFVNAFSDELTSVAVFKCLCLADVFVVYYANHIDYSPCNFISWTQRYAVQSF